MLRQLVTPLNINIEGKSVVLNVKDAIYDGISLILPWELESISDTDLYVVYEIYLNGSPLLSGVRLNATQTALLANQALQCGITSFMGTPLNEPTCVVKLKAYVFEANATYVPLSDLIEHLNENADDTETQDYYELRNAIINDVVNNGKLPIDDNGALVYDVRKFILVDSTEPNNTIADYTSSGVFKYVETIENTFSISLSENGQARTLYQDAVFQVGREYEVCIERLMVGANALRLQFNLRFPSEESLANYLSTGRPSTELRGEYYPEVIGNIAILCDEPERAENGMWSIFFDCDILDMAYSSDKIEIYFPFSITQNNVQDSSDVLALDLVE